MEETDWFSLSVSPVREGVYKTRHKGNDGKTFEGYSKFEGGLWHYTRDMVKAAHAQQYPSPQQSREWKGLK